MLTALLGSWRKGLERIEENSSKIASSPSQKGRFWVQTGTGELLGAVSPQAVLLQPWELSGAAVTPIAFFLFVSLLGNITVPWLSRVITAQVWDCLS